MSGAKAELDFIHGNKNVRAVLRFTDELGGTFEWAVLGETARDALQLLAEDILKYPTLEETVRPAKPLGRTPQQREAVLDGVAL